VEYSLHKPEIRNWNEEWEKNFQPVIIGNEIYVRADYHPHEPGYQFELVIHPRMAFGTGHHATTSLVMQMLLTLPVKGKKVLDMGCGTAILAILAAKLGASELLAIDNDENAVENAKVNCLANNESRIRVLAGDATTPGDLKFDIILANINRNIILDDLHYYVHNLLPGGSLVLSGFFTDDLPLILAKAKENQLIINRQEQQNNWCCVLFVKENTL
jgi:ribosomal protein L11 methyltransferase